MEYKKSQTLTVGFSFSTFEKEGIFKEGALVTVISVANALKTKHGPGFLSFFLLFKGKKNFLGISSRLLFRYHWLE